LTNCANSDLTDEPSRVVHPPIISSLAIYSIHADVFICLTWAGWGRLSASSKREKAVW
jgi:hypothetical protein